MKRLTRDEVQVERLLRASRAIAVLGLAARPGGHGGAVVEYLRNAGYEVYPVRADGAEVGGLASWARFADVPGPLDIVLVLDGPGPDRATIAQAADRKARAIWLSPGVTDGVAENDIRARGLVLVRGLDITVEHRHTEQVAGQPRKRGVSTGRRAGRGVAPAPGWEPRGGGGHRGGGGGRAVLDEKKMGRRAPRGTGR